MLYSHFFRLFFYKLFHHFKSTLIFFFAFLAKCNAFFLCKFEIHLKFIKNSAKFITLIIIHFASPLTEVRPWIALPSTVGGSPPVSFTLCELKFYCFGFCLPFDAIAIFKR